MAYLGRFQNLCPRHSCPQDESLEWLAAAHTESCENNPSAVAATSADTRARMDRLFEKYACSSERIRRRASECVDFTHTNWAAMKLFRLRENPGGAAIEKRMEFFEDRAMHAFDELFAEDMSPPRQLVHVTCTGYASPSAAQRLVQRRGWQRDTTVTHAYHMGCLAAFPAIRMASAWPEGADVVHTELCTLHVHPDLHDPEQCIVQSLFADGHIRYRVSASPLDEPHFEILALREELVPDSEHDMSWRLSSTGFLMSLSRDVPTRIASALPAYLDRLVSAAGFKVSPQGWSDFVFAVHPGGPKIIEGVQWLLGLEAAQVEASHRILRDHGNMSSATLPHVWEAILKDPKVKSGTPVVSLAFGPGLTIAGGIFVKRGA